MVRGSFPGFDVLTSSTRLSLAGAGLLQTSAISSMINPSIYDKKFFSLSIIRYPASITSQSAGLVLPLRKGYGHFSINNISYGIFQGYNIDAESTGTYDSNDTRLISSYSQGLTLLPINIGLSLSYFNSNYERYNFNIISFAFGCHINLEKHKALIGLSAHQIGLSYGNAGINMHPKVALSTSKRLQYLPSSIYIDIINSRLKTEIFTGIITDINKKIKLFIGSSTMKRKHDLKNNLLRSLLGASGIGFSYTDNSFSVHYGLFFYGTGSLNNGIELSIKI
tara:strand:+ start:839 stop:1678 length:840 start_codon:yes stop_codon:yes gene_type:complete